MPPPDPPVPPDPIHVLDAWKVDPPSDPELFDRVQHRIHAAETSPHRGTPGLHWIGRHLQRPMGAGIFAGVFLLLGVGLTLSWRDPGSASLRDFELRDYRRAIDPLYRLQVSAPSTSAGLPASASWHQALDWLNAELNLSPAQYAILQSLHREYDQKLTALFAELNTGNSRMQEFETLRLTSDLIDFIEVHRALTHLHQLEFEARKTTGDLVAQVGQNITPAQRKRYLALLDAAKPPPQSDERTTPPQA